MITRKNLVARIRRRLRPQGRELVCTPEAHGFTPLGDYCIVDADGAVVEHHVDLRELGRRLGVLGSCEVVEDGTRWPNTFALLDEGAA